MIGSKSLLHEAFTHSPHTNVRPHHHFAVIVVIAILPSLNKELDAQATLRWISVFIGVCVEKRIVSGHS